MIKENDYLRLYTGDTRIRQDNGKICIDKNDNAIWGDEYIYRTINAFLFPGIENEKARIREGQTFNYELMREPETLLQIMNGIANEILSQPISQKELVVFRMDRAASLWELKKGHISSFFSCKKRKYDPKFAKKENPIALEVHIPAGAHYADLEKILGGEYEMKEAEVLLQPYQCVSLSPLKQKNMYATEVYRVDVLIDKTWESNVGFEDESWTWDKAYAILRDSKCEAINGLMSLVDGKNNTAEIESYLKWKRALQVCFLLNMKDKEKNVPGEGR